MQNQPFPVTDPTSEPKAFSAFDVTVNTVDGAIPFTAIGSSSGAVACAAIGMFGGLCGVTVHPARVA